MKTWLWLVLAILTFMTGCAQGYYDSRRLTGNRGDQDLYQNPETEEEYEMGSGAKKPTAIELEISKSLTVDGLDVLAL